MRPETFSVLCLHFDPQAFATVHGAHHRAAPLDANAGSDCLKPNCLASLELISHAKPFTRDDGNVAVKMSTPCHALWLHTSSRLKVNAALNGADETTTTSTLGQQSKLNCDVL